MSGFPKQNVQLASHEKLFNHPQCPTEFRRASVVQTIQAGQHKRARRQLKRAYKQLFALDDYDFQFLLYLADLRNQINAFSPVSKTDPDTGEVSHGWTQTLMQGHGALRDYFNADIEKLIEAGLLYYPSIDGIQRKRLIRKPYYCITREALDCVNKSVQGPDIGDLGESVTHSLGCRLVAEYLRRAVEQQTGDSVRVEYFVERLVDEHTVDVVALKETPDNQGMKVFAVAEVETGLNRENEVLADMAKLGQVDSPRKLWVAPTRQLVNRMLNVVLKRDWYDIDPVPQDLPLLTGEGILHNTNRRLRDAEYTPEDVQWTDVPHTPVTDVLSYMDLYDILKNQFDASMFDTPCV
ncbi:hypothetical protein C453_17199 [Haloferax elongans ATCC BAA-1513]|uniref:Uncharacterized protein n=1 Tax=Haloferax elongans ATCC BAA-1513 TaxID=1230453 RepID=M0HFA8_HALEO|nr:hypothetical protein [Haloferax elongans]ELZ81774.1 hypothetical protein C453_17199 [Haloferax elongans ATCC BAA-1513]